MKWNVLKKRSAADEQKYPWVEENGAIRFSVISIYGEITEVAILRGTFFPNRRDTKDIRAEACKRGWVKPNDEVTRLIAGNLSESKLKDMKLDWVAIMSDPIKNRSRYYNPGLLWVTGDGNSDWIDVFHNKPGFTWSEVGGFAFVVPQTDIES